MTKLNTPVRRVSDATLDGSFGPDRNRRIVVTLHPNGTIELRPERTRRSEIIHLLDAYRYALRCRVNRVTLEKARDKKARKAVRLARQRQERAEKRLVERRVE